MRNKFTQQGSDVQKDDEYAGKRGRDQGVSRATSVYRYEFVLHDIT